MLNIEQEENDGESTKFDRIMTNAMANLTKRKYKFETDPGKRNRIRRKLLKKMENTIDEYVVRIGQQASVLTLHPQNNLLEVFGAQPLKQVLEVYSPLIKQELEESNMSNNVSSPRQRDPNKLALPELKINGEPRTINQLTQANLRSFIPLILKYATGRGKPGWGVPELKPVWWPDIAPWINIRTDSRTKEEKEIHSWTAVLQEIVKCCYRHFEQEELLYENDETGPDLRVRNAQPANNLTTEKTAEIPNLFYCESVLNESNENIVYYSINENQLTKREPIINMEVDSTSPSNSFNYPIVYAAFLNQENGTAYHLDVSNTVGYCRRHGIPKFVFKTESGETYVDA